MQQPIKHVIVAVLIILIGFFGFQPISLADSENSTTYHLELSRWGIYSDGTHPVETTNGINQALQWAHNQGYTAFAVPAGTYLISKGTNGNDPSARINLVSNMTFLLDPNAIIQKETNGYQGYITLKVGSEVHDAVIKGGTFEGDRKTHDFYNGSVKWQPNTAYKVGDQVIPPNTVADSSGYYYEATTVGVSGSKQPSWTWTKPTVDNTVVWKPVARDTHESGDGIVISGAANVTIEDVKTENFTGDGMDVGGASSYFQDLNSNRFVSGSIDSNGKFGEDSLKTRLSQNISISDPSFQKTHTFVLDNPKGLTWHFDVYFYNTDGSFLTKVSNQNRGDFIQIPDGAASFNAVWNVPFPKGAYIEFWNKFDSSQITIQNSETDFNRRQGITVGGGDQVRILNNQIHDNHGTAPNSGIDVEGGYGSDGFVNRNIDIASNSLYGNGYDVILYDGHDAAVEGNQMKSSCGLSVSESFTNAIIKNNTFNESSIYAYHDVQFINNIMNGTPSHHSYTHLEGPNLTIDGMTFNNADLNMSASQPYGITANHLTLNNSLLGTWAKPVRVTNAAINGGGLTGSGLAGSQFDHLQLLNNKGTDVPRGIYTNCLFETTAANTSPHTLYGGKYVFDKCTFKGAGPQFMDKTTDVAITNSTFDQAGILISGAEIVDIENNQMNEDLQLNPLFKPAIVTIGGYWTKGNPYTVEKATIKNNTITSNANAGGISTIFAGVGAPAYDVENNILHNAQLFLKANDQSIKNQINGQLG